MLTVIDSFKVYNDVIFKDGPPPSLKVIFDRCKKAFFSSVIVISEGTYEGCGSIIEVEERTKGVMFCFFAVRG